MCPSTGFNRCNWVCRQCARSGERLHCSGWGSRSTRERLAALLASPSLRKEMGAAGRHWVNETFAQERVWHQLGIYFARKSIGTAPGLIDS